MKTRKILAILIAVMVMFNLTACQGAQTETSGSKTEASDGKKDSKKGFPGTAEPDMVTLNVTSEPVEMNSMRLSDTISQSVLIHCMSGLTKLNEKDEPVADLAESWEINEDETVYTMNLRKDAKWSNGDSVTAHDFYYSWVTQMKPDTGTILANYLYQNIKNGEAFYKGEADEADLGLKVVDDYTLEINWAHPMANGLFHLSQPYYFPVNQKAYEEIGDEEYAKDADKIVTNGAYKITEWVHDDHITMEKSENYYGASDIKIPKVKLVMIGDANAGVNAFAAGELDLCSLYSEQIEQVSKQSEAAVQSYIDGGSWYLDFNMENEYLSNANLRKAFAYSIDVQSLLDYVINDGSVAADGFVPGVIAGAGEKSYTEERGSLFQYDKEAANEYLALALLELGIEKEELKLAFWGTDTTYNQNQAAYLQQQWKENLGLEVELRPMTAKALSEAKISGEYSFTVAGWGPSENDATAFLDIYETNNPNNYSKYSNPQYDKLLKDSAVEIDREKRQEMLIQAEKILIEDMAVGPMYFACSTYGISDKLKGLVRTPFQFFNVCNAYIQE